MLRTEVIHSSAKGSPLACVRLHGLNHGCSRGPCATDAVQRKGVPGQVVSTERRGVHEGSPFS